jgi:hypothetical protein
LSELEDLIARLDQALRADDPLGSVRATLGEIRGRAVPDASVLPPLGRPAELSQVARFVREVLVRPHARGGRFVLAPLIPVLGLPGSGKTSFLTALGNILTEQRARHHIPYEGEFLLEPLSLVELVRSAGGGEAHARLLAPWIVDLGWDFARRRTDAFLRHASFSPRTPPERGARFLVAQVCKDGAPYARLISIDTAGEDLRPIFRAGSASEPVETLLGLATEPSAAGVAASMLDQASALVVIIDSTKPPERRAESHRALFELLARSLRSRARDALRELARRLEEEERSGERTTLEDALLKLRRGHERWGEELCLELHRPLLVALGEALDPGGAPLERGDLRRLLRDVAALPAEKTLVRAIGPSLAAGLGRPDPERRASDAGPVGPWERAAARLRGVSLAFARALASEDGPAPGSGLFSKLRSISLVETKVDVGRPVSPFLLPECGRSLEEIQVSLRLLGGDVRTYETSVVGYAGLVGARHVPGPYSTQTPLNVLEPVFDLLGVVPLPV